MQLLRLFWSFLVRDFYTESSYRVSFLLSFVGVFFTSFTYYFISLLFGDNVSPLLQQYNGDYFSFVIIGVAFGGYFGLGLNGFARALREAQTTGTLEAMLMTPTSVAAIILGSAAWSYAFTTFRLVIYIVLGVALLGLDLGEANYLAGLVSLLFSIVTFASIGVIAASIIMVIKRGNPVTTLFGSVAGLVSGIYYPIEIMPDWLQAVAKVVPLTYALRAVRLALLSDGSWAEIAPDLLVLIGFCVVLFPLSLLTFRYAVQRARIDGSLTHY